MIRLAAQSVLVLAALLLPIACASPPQWREVYHDDSFESQWSDFTDIAGRSGYIPDNSGTDRGMRTYLSKWREQPAAFGRSRRSRLHAEFVRPEEGPGWVLRFHVQAQKVKDMKPGFEPQEEDWSDNGQDDEKETVLLGQLRLAFGQPLGIQPVRRDR